VNTGDRVPASATPVPFAATCVIALGAAVAGLAVSQATGADAVRFTAVAAATAFGAVLAQTLAWRLTRNVAALRSTIRRALRARLVAALWLALDLGFVGAVWANGVVRIDRVSSLWGAVAVYATARAALLALAIWALWRRRQSRTRVAGATLAVALFWPAAGAWALPMMAGWERAVVGAGLALAALLACRLPDGESANPAELRVQRELPQLVAVAALTLVAGSWVAGAPPLAVAAPVALTSALAAIGLAGLLLPRPARPRS